MNPTPVSIYYFDAYAICHMSYITYTCRCDGRLQTTRITVNTTMATKSVELLSMQKTSHMTYVPWHINSLRCLTIKSLFLGMLFFPLDIDKTMYAHLLFVKRWSISLRKKRNTVSKERQLKRDKQYIVLSRFPKWWWLKSLYLIFPVARPNGCCCLFN